eukprot:scaffold460_cov445-Prasinococcus_capsulatus_cf.AAC.6
MTSWALVGQTVCASPSLGGNMLRFLARSHFGATSCLPYCVVLLLPSPSPGGGGGRVRRVRLPHRLDGSTRWQGALRPGKYSRHEVHLQRCWLLRERRGRSSRQATCADPLPAHAPSATHHHLAGGAAGLASVQPPPPRTG